MVAEKENKTGKVYLVGAGPGDEGLITVKGLECIKKADVLVYDRLATDRLLNYAGERAEKIFVGKKPDKHEYTQDDINKVISQKAKEGKTVTRLKGGDPFVFGRGGEEAEVLASEGVSFEIVPGVTSAVAAPAYAGIPVTHRGISSSFSVITGHEDPTKETSQINWEKLATATDTLCFLMGMSNLDKITDNLMKYGRAKETPVALIRWGTRSVQQTLTGNLENISDKAKENGFKAPAVIVVGGVVDLREKLSWFDNKPLINKRIVVTRARSQASDLSNNIKELGGEPVEFPAIKIVPPESYEMLDFSISKIAYYDWLIFTSINGVEKFFERFFYHGRDIRELCGIKICAIGPKTREGLEKRGLSVEVMPTEYKAEAVLEQLKTKVNSNEKVLIPRAQVAREILPQTLKKMGLEVDVAPTYMTVREKEKAPMLKKALENGEVDAITFTSSSTVENFVEMIDVDNLAKLLENVFIACIGPITAKTCERLGVKVDSVAKEYTIPGLVETLLEDLE
ncbi:uroporphyrinogen-III C-methyltransferase [Natranaerofaba carboxydovora]|uniref:uroporphyrinogen-III C-methyltransferase n=1 Tax=Natranaerofaba carboxydovora TaxID=2742683 RepID=UPI001F13EE73|nr:uroporphyrinogen-III C-methyltransferase [Natranaerofaba carboxydovora]UMZ73205.1 Uroporphyrinogen-III C-methyltransferase [Natranaerofaba carboxydovora]